MWLFYTMPTHTKLCTNKSNNAHIKYNVQQNSKEEEKKLRMHFWQKKKYTHMQRITSRNIELKNMRPNHFTGRRKNKPNGTEENS